MVEDRVTTVLELAAVVLLALGLAAVTAALAGGGLLGYGLGISAAAVVLAGASVVLQLLARPAPRRGR